MTTINTKEISITKSWIANFVIEHSLCPFAHIPFHDDKIYYCSAHTSAPKKILTSFWKVCQRLLDDSSISNAFLILPDITDFDNLLLVKNVLLAFLEESSYDKVFQIVAFHPDFVFSGESHNHAGNFVNRSPYPMIHLLRVAEVSKALASLDKNTDIANTNKLKLEEIGSLKLINLLQKYYG